VCLYFFGSYLCFCAGVIIGTCAVKPAHYYYYHHRHNYCHRYHHNYHHHSCFLTDAIFFCFCLFSIPFLCVCTFLRPICVFVLVL
jgi:hypothetical protein